MKKTLFSLAFVAASGAYVATANHLFVPPNDGSAAVATDTALPATPSAITPTASTIPLVTPPQATAPQTPPVVAEAAPVPAQVAPAAPALVQTAPLVAEAAPAAMPPLPRRRPSPPTPAAIQPAASTDTAASPSGYRDGTYTGSDENAYYGRVQVQVTVTNHRVASVKVLDYPQDRRTSRYINSQALPLLKQEVIAADSSRIDTVSGATLTSEAYIRSLANALAQAGGANA